MALFLFMGKRDGMDKRDKRVKTREGGSFGLLSFASVQSPMFLLIKAPG